MRPVAVDPEELKWRRRSDARTLAEAEQIKADKERYQGAVLGAKEIAQEEIARVQGIAKVAGMKAPTAPRNSDPVGNTQTSSIPNSTQPFNKRGYRNPATIGRL